MIMRRILIEGYDYQPDSTIARTLMYQLLTLPCKF